ncbi:MAG: hypothetical protein SGI91_11695 [Alphaproteobacteria bacterium]|nr:hypothetical protein [Alphaproteobacteria bacterium]
MTKASILPRPVGHEDRNGPEIWVDEAIWGHRLHDEQTPWLTVLEFFCVLQAEHANGRALKEPVINALSYKPQTQLHLRNLVFNNPHIATTLAANLNDEAAWAMWHAQIKGSAGGIGNPDFSYLKDQFSSFADFAAVIRFLQNSAIEGASNKRWSSKFVFPFGPNSLFEDVSVSAAGGVSVDRRFFARTGELLYLMLTRSSAANALRDKLTAEFLNANLPHDRLVGALQKKTEYAGNERAGSYLPLAQYPAFDRLGEDWLAILKLPIPIYDTTPHLVIITGLNLALYQLERAAEVANKSRPTLVCEIVGPRRSIVRDLSADSFEHNVALPHMALERYIRQFADTPEWQAALQSEEPVLSAAELLGKQFSWPEDDDLEDRTFASPGELMVELERKATVRHRQHVGKVHNVWSRAIGLSSRRSSRRVRYAPTDRLLKTLVVCCVEERLEFKLFLELLFERYGIVVGEAQAKSIIDRGAADQESFADNARRLEERLSGLGLLRRLSDSCAYVENPFVKAAS